MCTIVKQYISTVVFSQVNAIFKLHFTRITLRVYPCGLTDKALASKKVPNRGAILNLYWLCYSCTRACDIQLYLHFLYGMILKDSRDTTSLMSYCGLILCTTPACFLLTLLLSNSLIYLFVNIMIGKPMHTAPKDDTTCHR